MGVRTSKRTGLTLVELLIVMILISVLSAAMMLDTFEMTASADAARIQGNLTQLKKALLDWYKENYHRVRNGLIDGTDTTHCVIEEKNAKDALGVLNYLNSNEITTLNENGRSRIKEGTYGTFSAGGNNYNKWYVGYRFGYDEDSVKQKLKGRAKEAGLYFTSNWPPETKQADGDDVVWMFVLDDSR